MKRARPISQFFPVFFACPLLLLLVFGLPGAGGWRAKDLLHVDSTSVRRAHLPRDPICFSLLLRILLRPPILAFLIFRFVFLRRLTGAVVDHARRLAGDRAVLPGVEDPVDAAVGVVQTLDRPAAFTSALPAARRAAPLHKKKQKKQHGTHVCT